MASHAGCRELGEKQRFTLAQSEEEEEEVPFGGLLKL